MHVATYSIAEPEELARYHENPSKSTHKVSLDPYRQASKQIFKIIRKLDAKVEKASVDEAFIDVTELVHKMLLQNNNYYRNFVKDEITDMDFQVDWTGLGKMEVELEMAGQSEKSSITLINDLRLHCGAQIASEIRKDILEHLGFTCSIGIGHNKTIAKICSGYKKPNNQTVLTEMQTLAFFKTLSISKIRYENFDFRFLGGKLGSHITENVKLGCPKTAGELWKYSKQELKEALGSNCSIDENDSSNETDLSMDTVDWIYDICRGIDMSLVVEKRFAKSFLSAKALRPSASSWNELLNWIKILANELLMRVNEELETNNRYPSTICVIFF